VLTAAKVLWGMTLGGEQLQAMGQTLAHPSAPPAWADVLRALLVLGLGVTSLVELCTYCTFPVNLMVLHCYRPALAISSPSNTVLNSCFLLSFFPDLTSVRPCHPSLLPHPPCFPAVACRASQFDSKVSPKAELWEWEPVQAVCSPGTHTHAHMRTWTYHTLLLEQHGTLQ
jgi:hypothetical protein